MLFDDVCVVFNIVEIVVFFFCVVFFQGEDGIRDLVRSRGLGDVYKRQGQGGRHEASSKVVEELPSGESGERILEALCVRACLLYTSDAADERSSVDLGGRRIINKKNRADVVGCIRRHTINYS